MVLANSGVPRELLKGAAVATLGVVDNEVGDAAVRIVVAAAGATLAADAAELTVGNPTPFVPAEEFIVSNSTPFVPLLRFIGRLRHGIPELLVNFA
jgi:hypothetical protein